MNDPKPAMSEGELSPDELRRFVEAFFDAVENGEYGPNGSQLTTIAANLGKTLADIPSTKQDDPNHELD